MSVRTISVKKLTGFVEKFSPVRIELKIFNESCNRVVTHAHRVASEEIFGPVLSVMTFRTPEEAFERANNIPYGLSAGVWTDNVIFKMVNKLRAGVVWANTCNKFDPTNQFGGYKESGFGREGGLQGLARLSCA